MMTAATKQQIREWVQKGYDEGASHVIVVCDTYDYDDYPVYVTAEENIRDRVNNFRTNMQKVMEVYSMKRDIDEQMNERVAWHYDLPEEEVKSSGNKRSESLPDSGGSG